MSELVLNTIIQNSDKIQDLWKIFSDFLLMSPTSVFYNRRGTTSSSLKRISDILPEKLNTTE